MGEGLAEMEDKSSRSASGLAGKRILVVEDDFLVSLLVEEALTEEGGIVVGPAYSAAAAMDIVLREPVDAAVMDVNLDGETTFAVAHVLEGRGTPFLFVSGYGQGAVPASHPHWRVCAKPFRNEDLITALMAQIRKV